MSRYEARLERCSQKVWEVWFRVPPWAVGWTWYDHLFFDNLYDAFEFFSFLQEERRFTYAGETSCVTPQQAQERLSWFGEEIKIPHFGHWPENWTSQLNMSV